MVTSDQRRRVLYDGVAKQLGADVAHALMDYLPPAGWSDLATRGDLDRAAAELRAEMHKEFADVRQEIAGLRGDMQREIGGLRGDMHTEIGELRRDMSAWGRTIVLSFVGATVTAVGAMAGLAATLGH